jgi:hypothetical protein
MSLSRLSTNILGATGILFALLLAFGCAILVMRLLLWMSYDVPFAP